ncbi:MAG: hypothetical protein HYW88_00725 [Candidatus Sungbacteria bacterium]|nr:hypothetical protein [Candidatus Sungbacteria bacterium]
MTPFLSEKILAISDNSRSVMMKGIRLLEKNGKTYIFHVFGASGGWHVDTLVLTPNLYKLAYSEALQSMVPLKKIQKKKTA